MYLFLENGVSAWFNIRGKSRSQDQGGKNSRLTQSKIDEIVNIPKGSRPDPATYLSQEYIDAHLSHFDDGGGLVRIDIDNLDGLNLRMPSGNEAGANSHWIPGGKTDGGVSEAITDLIPNNSSNVSIILLK